MAATKPATANGQRQFSKSANAFVSHRKTASAHETAHKTMKADKVRPGASSDEVALLREQLAEQQKQIEMLRGAIADQKQMIEHAMQSVQTASAASTGTSQQPNVGQLASLAPVVPALAKSVRAAANVPSSPAVSANPNPGANPVTQDQMDGYTKKVDSMGKTVEALNKGLAGFRLSGDFRLRTDNILRSSTSVAGPAQNVRARYRLRINVDKKISDQADFHMTLGTGTFNNPLTYDTDFTGLTSRGAFFLTEAYADYHPNSTLSLRGGKMTEVLADNSKFLLDDDVRFNGFHEIAKTKLGSINLQALAGQYILTNPNVQILSVTAASCTSAAQVVSTLPTTIAPPFVPNAACGWLAANFTPGHKVPATDLFDQGISLSHPGERWTHQFTTNLQLWRNPNSMQLGSIAAGFPLVVNPYYSLTLSGPITTGLGNGVTSTNGKASGATAIYSVGHYQVARLAYHLDYKGLKTGRQSFPAYLEVQAARNVGGSFYNNALMGSIGAGETKKFGDLLFRYGYFYKQANSIISQVTDDDVGTGTGVNLRTHMIRIDLGMNKYMVWQNYLYVQNELAANDPARNFFVPVQRGAGTQYRIQSQMLFTF